MLVLAVCLVVFLRHFLNLGLFACVRVSFCHIFLGCCSLVVSVSIRDANKTFFLRPKQDQDLGCQVSDQDVHFLVIQIVDIIKIKQFFYHTADICKTVFTLQSSENHALWSIDQQALFGNMDIIVIMS